MILAVVMLATAANWVPARWYSTQPKSLELVAQTPINCLLIERPQWSEAFAKEAARRGIATLAVLRPGASALEQAREAVTQSASGVVLEGDFDPRVRNSLNDSHLVTIDMTPRRHMRLAEPATVVTTDQGVWPGVAAGKDGEVKAAPTGAPWIDSNTGFLNFVRTHTSAPVWIANTPPNKTVLPVTRYLQAIDDAEISGAHWVVALDEDFNARLIASEPKAIADWKRIGEHLAFFETHKEWVAVAADPQPPAPEEKVLMKDFEGDRRNPRVRVFNAPSMRSNLLQNPDGKHTLLHLVNYSDFPAESVTVHLLGKYTRARLYTPEGAPQDLQTYDAGGGTGVDIDNVAVLATVVLE